MKPYHVNPSFTANELEEINAFLSATGGRAIRQFAREAILKQMRRELEEMKPADRDATKQIMKRNRMKTAGINDLAITNDLV